MTAKAFVSSTYLDLQSHRSFAIAALRKAGISVDPMEDWAASPEEPKNFSQQRLDGCSLCVLLVGFRRGHVPEGESLSITQLEYYAAQDRAIDTLVFMLDEDSPWPRKFDELDKDPGIRSWRKLLRERHGVSSFALNPETLDILSAISRWLAQASTTSAPKLVIQTIDFKCASQDRRNVLRLFNGHATPAFAEKLWLMTKAGEHLGPTFLLNKIVPPNSIEEIVSPSFRNDETAGESWVFPSDYRAGVIQTLDTNWARQEPGWQDERCDNGDPIFVDAVLSYRLAEERLLTRTTVWQGFSYATGRHWR